MRKPLSGIAGIVLGCLIPCHSVLPAWFIRGDVDASGKLSVTDAIALFGLLFQGEPATCLDAVDVDDNEALEVTDGIFLLDHLFRSGPPPGGETVFFSRCQPDATGDSLDCTRFDPCPPRGLFFCLDKSGSMQNYGRYEALLEEVVKDLQLLSEEDQFGLVFFDRAIERFPSSGCPVDATRAEKAAGVAFARAVQSDHGSCAGTGLVAALEMVERSTAPIREILFISDGWDLICPTDPGTLEEVLAGVMARNTARIPIHVLGVHDSDERWLKELARQNGGIYARATE